MIFVNYFFIAVVLLSMFQACSDAAQTLAVKPAYVEDDLFFRILEPEALSYFYKVRKAKDFGASFNDTFGRIPLVLADPIDACTASLNNPMEVLYNVALVFRGHCSFLTKALAVEQAGGRAVIIADNDEMNYDTLVDMIHDKTERQATIPSFWLVGKNGQMIRDKLKELQMKSALIEIPVNATSMTNILINQPPWVKW